MNKFILLATAVLMTACGDPIPPNGWVQNQMDMRGTPGLEDCKYFAVKTNTNDRTIHVIRCPNSSVNTQWEEPNGKTTISRNTIVIDHGKVMMLEKAVKDARVSMDALTRQLEAAKRGQ